MYDHWEDKLTSVMAWLVSGILVSMLFFGMFIVGTEMWWRDEPLLREEYRPLGVVQSVDSCSSSGKYSYRCRLWFSNGRSIVTDVNDWPTEGVYVGDHIGWTVRYYKHRREEWRTKNNRRTLAYTCQWPYDCMEDSK
jgi:hypothetical protein